VDYRLRTLAFAIDGKPDEDGREAQLWSANGKNKPAALSGFSVIIHLTGIDQPDVTVTIPVVADQLRIGGATLPPGWSLVPALE
jgi:hypothetical protein